MEQSIPLAYMNPNSLYESVCLSSCLYAVDTQRLNMVSFINAKM